MDRKVRAELEALGRDLSPEMLRKSQALFAQRLADAGPQRADIARDLFYGPHARHRLDVFRPSEPTLAPRPVLMFVHGGGFVGGDKTSTDGPFYDNVGHWAAAHGLIGVNLTYRLAPACAWPSGAQDVAAAVAWVAGRIAEHGGDPNQVFLMGQSAGAVHAASYVASPDLELPGVRPLAGAIFISGLFDIAAAEPNVFQQAYFGEDARRYADMSSLPGLLRRTDVPQLFSVSEFDPDDFQRQAALLVEGAMGAGSGFPRLIYLAGHNHISPVLGLGGDGDTLGPELLRFIEWAADDAGGTTRQSTRRSARVSEAAAAGQGPSVGS